MTRQGLSFKKNILQVEKLCRVDIVFKATVPLLPFNH